MSRGCIVTVLQKDMQSVVCVGFCRIISAEMLALPRMTCIRASHAHSTLRQPSYELFAI